MDPTTIQVYSAEAEGLAAFYTSQTSAASRFFPQSFTPGSRVLDVGTGSGRDVAALIAAGYDAHGVDASEGMLAAARDRFPDLAGRFHKDTLPQLPSVPDASQDGLLCWAVLMHLPEEHLPNTAITLRRLLKPGGRLLISTPLIGPDTNPVTHRAEDGRLFNGVPPETYDLLLAQVGFRRLHRWDTPDSLGRPRRTWATQLFDCRYNSKRSRGQVLCRICQAA
jgi:ubiquinone/menaquinone biosynthesis C-methylase UbiE